MPALNIGDLAPDFALTADNGESIALKDLRGSQVVLYFYPKDDTSGCTMEACGFRDAFASFREAGAVVLGVSSDGQISHRDFSRKFNLPFRLLCDEKGTVQRAYGAAWPVLSRVPGLGRLLGPKRHTYVIDAAGRIKAIFTIVNVDAHALEVLEVLKK
jgi:peroxiredoxin Q/BCP